MALDIGLTVGTVAPEAERSSLENVSGSSVLARGTVGAGDSFALFTDVRRAPEIPGKGVISDVDAGGWRHRHVKGKH